MGVEAAMVVAVTKDMVVVVAVLAVLRNHAMAIGSVPTLRT